MMTDSAVLSRITMTEINISLSPFTYMLQLLEWTNNYHV
jgi:hypothetical protein